jgi:hypothetical protein
MILLMLILRLTWTEPDLRADSFRIDSRPIDGSTWARVVTLDISACSTVTPKLAPQFLSCEWPIPDKDLLYRITPCQSIYCGAATEEVDFEIVCGMFAGDPGGAPPRWPVPTGGCP